MQAATQDAVTMLVSCAGLVLPPQAQREENGGGGSPERPAGAEACAGLSTLHALAGPLSCSAAGRKRK